jgi:hypothetical protein
MTSSLNFDELVATIVHEIHHVLAFTKRLYPSFPAPPKYLETALPEIMFVTSPNVLVAARHHYDCPTLTGMPLESAGGDGTADTHWAMRVCSGELMSPAFERGIRMSYSAFTLAFLQDSGWYITDFMKAVPLEWGKNAGCDFARIDTLEVGGPTCAEASASAPVRVGVPPFICENPVIASQVGSDVTCTYDGFGVGPCRFIPPADEPPPDQSCGQVWSSAASTQSLICYGDSPDPILSDYGNGFGGFSRCLLGGADVAVRNDGSTLSRPAPGAGCFTLSCSQGGQLLVQLFGLFVRCPVGESIDLSSLSFNDGVKLSGKIGPCPDSSSMCPTLSCPLDCSTNGKCSDGVCYCEPGWSGIDCALATTNRP